MPYKRKYNKRNTRRKKRSSFKRSLTRTNGPGFGRSYPMPQVYKYYARYVEASLDINPGVGGVPASHVFSLNGLYDPNITGVGHQPLGFDQLMPMYDHYCVIGAKVRFTASNLDPVTPQNLIMQVKDTSVVSTATSNIIENGMCRFAVLGPLTSNSTKTLSLSVGMNKFFGKNVLDEDAYRGSVITNPNEQCFLHLQVDPLAGVDTQPIRGTLLIEYIALLREPRQLITS